MPQTRKLKRQKKYGFMTLYQRISQVCSPVSWPRVSFIPRVNADTLVFTTATVTEIELGY